MTLSIGLDAALSGLSITAEQTSVVSRNVARAGDPERFAQDRQPRHAARRRRQARLHHARQPTPPSTTSCWGRPPTPARSGRSLDALDRLDGPSTIPSSMPRRRRWWASSPMPSRGMPRPRRTRPPPARRSPPQATWRKRSTTRRRPCSSCAQQADADIAGSVDRVNTLLAQFETVNAEIVKGTRQGADVTDYLDQRDQILAGIAEEVGVRTVTRADNDMAVYTDSGVTLFDVRPRTVSFDRTLLFMPTTSGNAVYVDGVPDHGQRRAHAGGIGAPDGPCRRARRRCRHLSKPARRDRARADPGLCRERPERDADAARRARPLHLCRCAGDAAGRQRADRACRHDQGQCQRRPRPRRQCRPPARRRHLRQSGLSLQRVRRQRLYAAAGAAAGPPQHAAGVRCGGAGGALGTVAGFAASSVSWLQEARKSADADGDTRPRSRTGPRRRCPRPPASTSTKR